MADTDTLVFNAKDFAKQESEGKNPFESAPPSPAASATAPSEPVQEAPKEQPTGEQPTSQPSTEQIPEPGEEDAPVAGKRDKRIAGYYQLRGENGELRRRLEALESAQTVKPVESNPATAPVSDPSDPKPAWDPEKYKEGGYDEFVVDLSKWGARQERKVEQQNKLTEQFQNRSKERVTQFNKGVADEIGVDKYQEAVATGRKFTNPHQTQFIAEMLESDHSHKIAYHLLTHPELVAKIDGLPLTAQLRELGKLETLFEAEGAPSQNTPNPGVSKAPPPIRPVNGTPAPKPKSAAELAADDKTPLRVWAEKAGVSVNKHRSATH